MTGPLERLVRREDLAALTAPREARNLVTDAQLVDLSDERAELARALDELERRQRA